MTGYPADLLDPDLDLEADLGVDTVKQAEVFAAVRAHYNVERDDTMKLRDFPTLRHVAGWVRGKAGLPEPSAAPVAAAASAAPASASRRLHAPAPGAPAASPGADEVMARGHRDRRRADRLPGRPARPRPRPGSRPRRRHRQASRSLRRRPRALRRRTRRHLKLRDFPTIKHVAGWVRGKAGMPEPSAAPPAVPTAAPGAPHRLLRGSPGRRQPAARAPTRSCRRSSTSSPS
jgi:hypothetical protein